MSPEFAAALNAKLEAYRTWALNRSSAPGRLVKYEGIEFAGAIDVLPDALVEEVNGLFREGYQVDWSEHQGRIYLLAWEGDEHGPNWNVIYQEKDLMDIEALRAKRGKTER